VRQAIEKRYSVMEDINNKRRVVEREAQDAFSRIRSAIVQIGALEQSVKAQKSLVQSRSRGYRSGKNSILDLLDAQQDLSQAEQALTKARYDYVLNILRLKFAVGDLQEEDLATVNGWLQ
jgi:outer membrane protein